MISQYKWYKRKNIKARHINSIVITYMKHIGASEWTFNAANLVYAWSGPRVSDIGKAVRHSLRRKELNWSRCEMHAYHNESVHLVIYYELDYKLIARVSVFYFRECNGTIRAATTVCHSVVDILVSLRCETGREATYVVYTCILRCTFHAWELSMQIQIQALYVCSCNSKCQLKLEAVES